MLSENENSKSRVLSPEISLTAPPTTPLDELATLAEKLDADERLRLIVGLWASLPPWHQAALKSAKLSQLRKLLDDYDTGQTDHFPWLAFRTLIADSGPSTAPKVYSVPRRFDLSTVFVITLAYSLLMGAMKGCGVPPLASVIIAGFISLVGAGQAILFGGNQPRKASVVIGTLLYSIAMLAVWLYNGPRLYPTVVILIMTSYSLIGGAILGYLSGAVVGGVFLVADKVRKQFSRKALARDPLNGR